VTGTRTRLFLLLNLLAIGVGILGGTWLFDVATR
jgi:hypothetical protein